MSKAAQQRRFTRRSVGGPPPNIVPGLGVDVPELRQARALWAVGRFDEAVVLFDHAVRKYPQNLLALIDASRALGARFEIKKAEPLLDRLTKLGAHNPELLHLAGQSYRMIFRPDKAIECFQRVLARTKTIPDAQLELGVLYERRHKVIEAFDLIEDCLRQDPAYAEAEFFKARLLRRLKDNSSAVQIFQKLSTSENVHPLVRAQAWNELAQNFDREGDYDCAMDALRKSKELIRVNEADLLRESEGLQRHLNTLVEAITSQQFQAWTVQAQSLDEKKTAVLAGFPRSGTTLLEQVLDSHPQLVSSDEREAFGRDIFPAMWRAEDTPLPTATALDRIPAARLLEQRNRYLEYMEAALNSPIGDRVHLDKNPTMTLLLPGLLRLFPETRVLIALRDPRDVVLSCFMQYLPLNTNSVSFLSLERTARRYAHDLGAWLRLREKISSPWREVKYEACVHNLAAQAQNVLQFLDLPWDPQVLQYRERLEKKAVSSPTYEAVSKPLYTTAIGRWQNYSRHFEPVLPILEPFVREFGY